MAPRMPGPVVKIHRRLLPLFVSLVVVCYLDRTSLAFAALQLCHEDWFNAKVYGLGSGVFYAGYVLFQVPSNLILSRLGARTWLPFITAVWGCVATCCIFIRGPASFYVLRLALGVAEAGAFPAMWHVCGQFYPASYITVAYSVIEASIAISQIIAAPVAAGLLQLSGVGGLAGWQHLFLVEGLATLVLAGILRWRLPGSVLTADFLAAEDKLWLMQQLGPCVPQHSSTAVAVEGSGDASTQSPGGTVTAAAGCAEAAEEEEKGQLCAAAACEGRKAPSTSNNSPVAGQQDGPECPNGIAGDVQQQAGQQCQAAPTQQQQQQQHTGSAGLKPAELSAGQQLLLTFKNRLIWYLMLLKALKDIALDGLVYWVPLLVHALIDSSAALGLQPSSSSSGGGSSDDKHCGGKDSQLRAVLLTAIPFGTAAIAALTLGHSSEVTQERRKHIGLPLLLGGAVFASLPWLLHLQSHVPAFLAVTAAVVAADATTGPFWTWVHMAAAPGTEAVSLAAVNSVGKAGGFLGPLSFGLILSATGSYVPSILLVAAVLMLGGCLALSYRGEKQHQQYSKLQETEQHRGSRQHSASPEDCNQQPPQQQWQQQQKRQHHPRHAAVQKLRTSPELELLRGSSGDSYNSS